MDVFSAHQAFALNLYNTFAMANEGKNFLMSPMSIFAALSIVLPGAREETLHQMLRAMRLNSKSPLEDIEAALGKMLATGGTGNQLFLANKAYIQAEYNVRQEYLATLRNHFGTDVARADFARDPESERQRVNNWVATITRGKIAELLQSGAVNSDTRLILVNALYFKANWSSPFDPSETSDQAFEIAENAAAPVSVQTMHQTDDFPVIDVPDVLTAVRFDFKEDAQSPSAARTSLFAVLPAKRHRLDALLSGLSQEAWLRVINTPAKPQRVAVALPKVRLSGRAELSEPEFLPSLGIKDLFEDKANLTGMGPGNLSVSSCIHQAVLEVDEFGAEGAAATAMTIELLTSIHTVELPPREIKFDQPFMLILAKEVGASPQLVPIFMGRVSDPRET